MAISLPSCVTWRFCFLWFPGHRAPAQHAGSRAGVLSQHCPSSLVLAACGGRCEITGDVILPSSSPLALPVLMHVRKHQCQFCSSFYAQMRKDSCPATSEGPVQPYLGVRGVPEGCPPAPQAVQRHARTAGRHEAWLGRGLLLVGEVDMERKMQG